MAARHFPLLLLLLVVLAATTTVALEATWTPADGEGPAPLSKKYRDSMERLAQLEAEHAQRDFEHQQKQASRGQGQGGQPPVRQQQQQPQQRPQPPQQMGLIGGLIHGAIHHPIKTAGLLATSWGGLSLYRSVKQTGLLVSKAPYTTLLEPPVTYLARLLNDELPEAASSVPAPARGKSPASFHRLHKAKKKDKAEDDSSSSSAALVVQSTRVGNGEVAFRKAASLVRTLRLLDRVETLGRFYSSERGQEGLFVARRQVGGGGWGMYSLMPVSIVKHDGKVKQKKKGDKAATLYEEVILRSLQGCPWEGELRLSASWEGEGGGDDSVHVEVAWHTTSGTGMLDREGFAAAVLRQAKTLLEQEMVMYRVREKQQAHFAQAALEAEKERRKKEREAILNPPPDKKKWAKMNRGSSVGGRMAPHGFSPVQS